jgi:transcriptional regulator with XRE-family HTH domain
MYIILYIEHLLFILSNMAKKNWKTELGKSIKAARKSQKMSQRQLASRVRASHSSICSFERGIGNPEFRVVAAIAAELKVEFNVLGCRISGKDVQHQPSPPEQLELEYERDHKFLANVTIRPTKKSITITTEADFGIRSA